MIHGLSDFDYVKSTENWESILGKMMFLEEGLIMFRSGTQKYVCL